MPSGYNSTGGSSIGTAAGYQSDCLACPAGYYCLNATVTPSKCGKGYFTKLGQSVCQVCKVIFVLINIIQLYQYRILWALAPSLKA